METHTVENLVVNNNIKQELEEHNNVSLIVQQSVISIDEEEEEGVKDEYINSKEVKAKKHIERLIRNGPNSDDDNNPNTSSLVDEYNSNSNDDDWLDQELYLDGLKFFESYRFSILVAGVMSLILCSLYRPLLGALLRNGKFHGDSRAFLTRIAFSTEAFNKWSTAKDIHPKSPTAMFSYKVGRIHVALSKSLAEIPMPPLPKLDEKRKLIMKAIQNDVTKIKLCQLPECLTTYYPNNFITQLDHTIAGFSMTGLILLVPTKFGIPVNYCKRSHKGYLHAWFIACKRLGIQDEYNIGAMSQEHAKEIVKQVLLPCCAHVDEYNMDVFSSNGTKDYWNPITIFIILLKQIFYRPTLWFCLHDILELEAKEFRKFLTLVDICIIYHWFVLLCDLYRRFSLIRWIINQTAKYSASITIKICYLIGK